MVQLIAKKDIGIHTPDEIFEKEIDRIYQAV
ncbi:Protein of unknown function [Lactobacillus gigeriorum DSM 23908 = CRBIP 24.85]|uniref:Uncharacterized protein n=1 Tax=Lactobacillus gigeriorum DSM 23908 = CRBIP 24.85 TaxID=1423751 RepID=I7LGE6_9LACO|nr:Protein of unknown function [Lactobacillus gigeriorum DSM 23908 = CRBIP 24.85]